MIYMIMMILAVVTVLKDTSVNLRVTAATNHEA